jgi:diaminopimelate decarboxylase
VFHFAYGDDGQMAAEGIPLSRIAEAVGTPTYVYAQATLERHLRVFDEAFSGHPHLVCYAMKANSSQAILRLVADRGGGADIVSGGELFRALRAGIPAERIVFSGVGKTADEMAEALRAKVLCLNVESEPELFALAGVAAELGVRAPVSLRVNPDIDAQTHPYIATGLRESKFGIPIDDAPGLAERVAADPNLELVGIDCHIGSQIVSLAPLLGALDSVIALSDQLRGRGHAVRHLDIGGGLGIPYDRETPPHPSELGRAVVGRMKGRPESIILEPGRVIVGNAGVLLTRVLYVKDAPARRFVIVDAAMNDLMRPSLYDAHHDIWTVKRSDEAERRVVDVVGPVCESGDTFARERSLPPVQAGDLIAIMSAGAYGYTMASNYNSRARACEVLVHGDRWAIVRQRERNEALVAGESVPAWLEGADD